MIGCQIYKQCIRWHAMASQQVSGSAASSNLRMWHYFHSQRVRDLRTSQETILCCWCQAPVTDWWDRSAKGPIEDENSIVADGELTSWHGNDWRVATASSGDQQILLVVETENNWKGCKVSDAFPSWMNPKGLSSPQWQSWASRLPS